MQIGKSVAIAATLALAVAGTLGWAQIQKGKTRPLETKIFMKTVNGPHCSTLAKQLKAGITDDAGWQEAATHAQMLNEAGFVLMADGRCPDKVWADASKDLSEGSAAVLQAVNAKNAADANAGLQKVLGSCKSCHAVHRMKK